MNWSIITTILVGFHLTAEFIHYILEFIWGKKDKNILANIVKHRKASQKTKLLNKILGEIQSLKHIKNNDYPYITYEALTGEKNVECCTCDFFHEGNGVEHSHCDSHKDGSLKNYVLQYDGKLPACCYWSRLFQMDSK